MQLTYRKAALVAGMLVLSSSVLAASTPLTADALPGSWAPAGWTVAPLKVAPTQDEVEGVAVMTKDGHQLARLTALVARSPSTRSLADKLDELVGSESRGAASRGLTTTASGAVADSWHGLPALRNDMVFSRPGGTIHQRAVIVQTPEDTTCALVYVASGATFDAYYAEFEHAKDRFVCPGQGSSR